MYSVLYCRLSTRESPKIALFQPSLFPQNHFPCKERKHRYTIYELHQQSNTIKIHPNLSLLRPFHFEYHMRRMFSFFLKSPLLSNTWRLFSSAEAQRRTTRPRCNDPLVFIDCEMTGLDPERDTIMSIACFVTDAQLKLLDEHGWESFIHHDKSTLDRMDAWCTKTHGVSGLTAACIASTTTSEQAAEGLLAYIKRYVPEGRRGLLAGNSVHFDRAFLNKSPYTGIVDYLGYRILDVSSLKEAATRWAPEEVLLGVPAKKYLHQAKEDILESIEEARYYREKLFTK